MFVLAYTLSKVSLALFVRRLFTHNTRLNAVLCWSLLGITVAWSAVALCVLLVNCSPYHYFSQAEKCASYVSITIRPIKCSTDLKSDGSMASHNNIRYRHRSCSYDRAFLPSIRCSDRLATENACHDCFRIQTRVSTHLTPKCDHSDEAQGDSILRDAYATTLTDGPRRRQGLLLHTASHLYPDMVGVVAGQRLDTLVSIVHESFRQHHCRKDGRLA